MNVPSLLRSSDSFPTVCILSNVMVTLCNILWLDIVWKAIRRHSSIKLFEMALICVTIFFFDLDTNALERWIPDQVPLCFLPAFVLTWLWLCYVALQYKLYFGYWSRFTHDTVSVHMCHCMCNGIAYMWVVHQVTLCSSRHLCINIAIFEKFVLSLKGILKSPLSLLYHLQLP